MTRKRLSNRRQSFTETIFFGGEKYHLTFGFFSDGIVGEVFLTRVKDRASAKLGTQLESLCRDAAIIVSLGLQYGVPVNVMCDALTRDETGEPQTILSVVVDELVKERP